MEERNFKVTRTRSLKEWVKELTTLEEETKKWPKDAQKHLLKMFDEVPVEDIRKACLNAIWVDHPLDYRPHWGSPPSSLGEYMRWTERVNKEWERVLKVIEENIQGMMERLDGYLKINDFETALMLLRALSRHKGSHASAIVEKMVEVTEYILRKSSSPFLLKEPLVILCGKINHHPKLYNEKVRKVFQEIIEKYDPRSLSFSGHDFQQDECSRLLLRIISTVCLVGDTSFIPLLRQWSCKADEIYRILRYTHTQRDTAFCEGVRRLAIQCLERLSKNE